MPPLASKPFPQLVSEKLAVLGAQLGVTPDWQPGSAILAWTESGSTQEDFLQGVINAVYFAVRLSTAVQAAGPTSSVGPDVDSYIADFGLTRLPATFNSGQVTCSLLAPQNVRVVIPAGTPADGTTPPSGGAIVQTPGGAVQYVVIADPTNGAYSTTLNGYPIPADSTSVICTVQATVAGTSTNVQAGQLTQFATSAPADIVTNANPIQDALNAETNGAILTRFTNFILGLSRSTGPAYDSAIASVQQGLRWTKEENTNPSSQTQYGFNTIYVDDGSGDPSSTLLQNVGTALNNYRALGVQVAVEGPTVVTINIACTCTVSASSMEPTNVVKTNVQNALSAYIQALGFTQVTNGVTTYSANVLVTRLYQVAYDADPNVQEITGLTVNSGTTDITITGGQLPLPGTITVS